MRLPNRYLLLCNTDIIRKYDVTDSLSTFKTCCEEKRYVRSKSHIDGNAFTKKLGLSPVETTDAENTDNREYYHRYPPPRPRYKSSIDIHVTSSDFDENHDQRVVNKSSYSPFYEKNFEEYASDVIRSTFSLRMPNSAEPAPTEEQERVKSEMLFECLDDVTAAVERCNIEQRIYCPDEASLAPTDTCSDITDDGWVSEEIRAVDLACSKSSISVHSHELVPSPLPYQQAFIEPIRTRAANAKRSDVLQFEQKPFKSQPALATRSASVKWRERRGVYTFQSVRSSRGRRNDETVHRKSHRCEPSPAAAAVHPSKYMGSYSSFHDAQSHAANSALQRVRGHLTVHSKHSHSHSPTNTLYTSGSFPTVEHRSKFRSAHRSQGQIKKPPFR